MQRSWLGHYSVADPGCLSRIPDPKTAKTERGEQKFTKLNIIYFIFEMLKKKNLEKFSKNYLCFYQKKNVHYALKCMGLGSGIRDPGSEIRDPRSGIRDPGSEIRDPRSGIRDTGSGIRDPGSGKNLFRIPESGVKKALDPGSRIRIRNTGH